MRAPIHACGAQSEEKGLTVVTGAQRRYQKSYVETVDKIKSGAVGDIVATYRLLGRHAGHPTDRAGPGVERR